ncbi:MAG: hypothetical protein KY433_05455, partial [Actinobacteria bacterium]|nr:hypothetical protein [Actinomycetota bacterium]
RIGITDDVPLVGVLGRLTAIKDLPSLFRAMKKVPGAHLAVFGDGEDRPSLEALRIELQMEDRIHFMGWWTDVPSALGLDFDLTQLSFGIFGFLLLIMMVLRPEGLIPERRRQMELRDESIETDEAVYEARLS